MICHNGAANVQAESEDMPKAKTKAEFLRSFREAVRKAALAGSKEIKLLVEQRNLYFGGNMRRVFNIDSWLVDSYDQMVRDKKVVNRRFCLFYSKLQNITAKNLTLKQKKLLGDEAINIANHSQAVGDYCAELSIEMQKISEAMDKFQSSTLLSEGEDFIPDLIDTKDDEHSEDDFSPFP